MASWAALNAEAPRAAPEHTRDVATEEAQEARNAVLYERALRRQQQRKNADAKAIYTELLETSTGLSPRLRYLCAKNLATLEAELQDYDAALKHFSEALTLDATDVLVWHQMGKAALATGQLWLARQAFESGFQVDSKFWPLVHLLCDVLHAIGDNAAYNRIAHYLLEHDPDAAEGDGPLRRMDAAVDPDFRVLKSSDATRRTKSLKRVSMALEASIASAKKRKLLTEESCDDAQRMSSRAPLTYLLQQSSWLSLGKLLLEAYQDVLSEQKAVGDVTMLRNVRVSVDFSEEPEPTPVPAQAEDKQDGTSLPTATVVEEQVDVDLTVEDAAEEDTMGTLAEPIEVDQEDDEHHEGEDARQTSRRKSRRHEEKLREEHELAAKQAREKNLAYRLQTFVPTIANEEEGATERSQGVVFRVRQGAVVLEAADGTELHVFEDVFPRSTEESEDSSAVNESESHTVVASEDPTRLIERDEIADFVEKKMGAAAGYNVLSLLREYLNQSGTWAERKLESSSEKVSIHPVVLWAEKAVAGRLEPPNEFASGQNGAVHTQVALSRRSSHGCTPESRLFVLELRLDEIFQQNPQRGPARARRSSRSVVSQLDDMQEEAQCLLLDLCSTHDLGAGITDAVTLRLLVRLLWFCGMICEFRGETNDAKEYFAKCKQELDACEAQVVVHLVNLHDPVEISASSVELKIASLQYAEVCTEAKEMATVAHFDEAQTQLLVHFFPADGQPSRVEDLLEDFAASEREADARTGTEEANAEEHNLLELLLRTVEQSSNAPCSKKILILLVLLDQLLTSLRETRDAALSKRNKEGNQRKRSGMLSTTIQAIKLTVDRLASIISADANTDATVCSWTRRAAMMGLSKLLTSSTVLLFDSPRDVLLVVYDVEEQLCGDEATSIATAEREKLREHLLFTVFESFRAIRSLSASDLQRLLDAPFSASGSTKSKRKPSTRRDRVRPFIQGALAHMVTGISLLLTDVLCRAGIKALMEALCALLKEEEEILGRRYESDKIGRKIVASGAVLFLHLFVASSSRGSEEKDDSIKDLVALVELLHERLGQHELCTSKCVDVGGKDGSSFVAVAVDYLSDRRADYARLEMTNRQKVAGSVGQRHESDEDTTSGEKGDEGIAEESDEDVAEGFDRTLAQCFRCLYDVHISTDCADHKADVSTQLEDAPIENAVLLARFAIPMMLRRSPRNNAQKKDNLKILFALRRAIDMDNESRPCPVQPSEAMIRFTKPLGVLSWKDDAPLTEAVVNSSQEAECLDNLWFLLGENFILVRVRRRSNLTELIEMERRIKERVAFLIKDVHYYRPGRIRSWSRLGKALKELYQVTSDACSLLLNQIRMADALLALSNKISSSDGDANVTPSFPDYVLDVSLFERMKEWEEQDSPSQKAEFRVKPGDQEQVDEARAESSDQAVVSYGIEEFAVLYMSQLVEFARRCFDMAEALARQRVSAAAVEGGAPVSEATPERCEHSQAELNETIVECCEESGLLLYNYLQEFSSIRRHTNANGHAANRKFPVELYGQVLEAAHKKFEQGLGSSQLDMLDAHAMRFRFQYMIGKVLKKRVWLQQGRDFLSQSLQEKAEAAKPDETRSIMACFAAAEDEHEKGKMEKSIVHAFYQLQAMRLELVLNDSATAEQLTLACDYYFEEAADDEDEEEDDEDEGKDEKMEDDQEKDAVVKVGKEDVAAILSFAASSGETNSGIDYLCLARAWLFYNVIDALESISDEDRYFHPSRHAVARAMYHFHHIVRQLAAMVDSPLPEAVAKTSPAACISMLEEKLRKKKNDGASPAETAVKEMHALFDKRRPQVVAIWLSEHVPASKKFEELNQRQLKFDVCRLKYLRYYVGLLKESQAYARIKEIGSWVMACKEEHDAISEMLGVVFHARGVVQLSRLKDFVCGELVDQLQRYRARHDQQESVATIDRAEGGLVDLTHDVETPQADDPRETLVKELGKAYVNFVDVAHSRDRLAAVLSEVALQELVLLAEFPVVCLFVIGAIEFPTTFEHEETPDTPSAPPLAEISPKLRAMLLNEDLSLEVCGESEWKPLLDAARRFCEKRWPDRHGKPGTASKTSRRPRPTKASAATSTASVAAPETADPPATESGSGGDVAPVLNEGDVTHPTDRLQAPLKAVPAEI